MHPAAVSRLSRAIVLTAAVALFGVSAGAQGRGPGEHGGDRGGFGLSLGHGALPGNTASTSRVPPASPGGESGAGLQLGPPGRWWDNKDFARNVGLNSLQQHRMDDVFSANRDNLMKLYKSLQHEESQLKKMTRSQTLDENQIFQQIDRVTVARGELSKAYAHMELQIRREMTSEQTAKLDEMNAPPAQ
jgi:Spy/CpxP family protein refolding chaperone